MNSYTFIGTEKELLDLIKKFKKVRKMVWKINYRFIKY
jgi:hypothetical protein